MEDIELLIKTRCEYLNRIETTEFKDLLAEYLSKVINNEVRDFDARLISTLGEEEVNRVLNRIQDENLKPLERRRIQDTITRIVKQPSSIAPDDLYIGQLFAGLMKMSHQLEQEERSLVKFIEVCNLNYLVNKELEYSRSERTVKIRLKSKGRAEPDYMSLSIYRLARNRLYQCSAIYILAMGKSISF